MMCQIAEQSSSSDRRYTMHGNTKFGYWIVLVGIALSVIVTQQQEIPEYDPCDGVDSGDFVRGPINCSHYIYCDDDGDSYDDFCKDGQFFNNESQGCDDADNVQCGDDEEYEYDSDEDEEYEYEYESEEADDRDNEEDPSAPKTCPRNDNPGNVVFIPSTKSCSQYFLCYHGTSIPMQCADSLHFNLDTKKCDFPKKTNCKIADPEIPTSHPKCDKDTFDFYPHPTHCDFFYYCRKGYLSVQQCPFYYYFDGATKTCQIRDGTQIQCIKR